MKNSQLRGAIENRALKTPLFLNECSLDATTLSFSQGYYLNCKRRECRERKNIVILLLFGKALLRSGNSVTALLVKVVATDKT